MNIVLNKLLCWGELPYFPITGTLVNELGDNLCPIDTGIYTVKKVSLSLSWGNNSPCIVGALFSNGELKVSFPK